MMLEIDDMYASEITLQELTQMCGYLKADLERHGRGEFAAVFTTDPIEDCAKIYDMIEAITKICAFYGAQDV